MLTLLDKAVYGSEGRLTRKFISSTKSALKDIAEISDELKQAFGGLRGSYAGGISRVVAHLHLLHHQASILRLSILLWADWRQCVVLATRPLLFSLLRLRFDEPNGGGPLAAALGSASRLLQTCVESSQHIVAVLDKLKEQNLLGEFDLPHNHHKMLTFRRKLSPLRSGSSHCCQHRAAPCSGPRC